MYDYAAVERGRTNRRCYPAECPGHTAGLPPAQHVPPASPTGSFFVSHPLNIEQVLYRDTPPLESTDANPTSFRTPLVIYSDLHIILLFKYHLIGT